MSDKDLKKAYMRGLEAVARILHDLDPDAMGGKLLPPDEYQDAAAKLMPALWAAETQPEATEAIRRSFPAADQSLLDALWAARQSFDGSGRSRLPGRNSAGSGMLWRASRGSR